MCAKYENMWMLDDVDNDGDDVETNGELFVVWLTNERH